MYKNILIATDGSALADKAVDSGIALAKALGGSVVVLTATEPWTATVSGEMTIGFPAAEYDQAMAAHAKTVLDRATAAAQKAGVACQTEHAKDAFPAEAIVEIAKKRGCDLIVMASHGRRGVSRMLLGSQANRVVTHSTVPVLICR